MCRSGSDASPVLWRDPLGGLPCQSFPATGGCSQQLSQSAGSKPGPAEPTAGQSTACHKTGKLIATGPRLFSQCTPCLPVLMCILFYLAENSLTCAGYKPVGRKCFIQLLSVQLLSVTPAQLIVAYPNMHISWLFTFISLCVGTLFLTLTTREYEHDRN